MRSSRVGGIMIAWLLAALVLPVRSAGPPIGDAQAVLLLEMGTGTVLFQHSAKEVRPPASIVKMMVALLAYEAIRSGEIDPERRVTVSREAARASGSRVLLRAGESLPLRELLHAMLIASANDASIVVAEALAGSVPEMLLRMNQRALALGMIDTVFTTVNGLPPRGKGPRDMTTARDLATLAREVARLDEILGVTGLAEASIRNGRTRIKNTNKLVGDMNGLDGLKTGYYRVAGFNLAATAQRDGMRLISVVMGCPNQKCRFDVTRGVLEWGFATYGITRLVDTREPLSVIVEVQNGTSRTVRPIAAESSTYLLRRDELQQLKVHFQLPETVAAPIFQDQPLGEIIIEGPGGILDVIPAIAPTAVGPRATALRPAG